MNPTESSVSRYADDLYDIAEVAYPRNPFIHLPNPKLIYALAGAGLLGSYFVSNLLGYDNSIGPSNDAVYRGVAVLAAFVGRALDQLSTRKVFKEFDDRFFEYGLDSRGKERNLFMPDKPTIEILNRRTPIDVAVVGFSYFVPLLGYPLGAIGPHTYNSNSLAARNIIAAKKAGNVVKTGLDNGMSDEEIIIMLGELKGMDKDELRRYLESYR